MTKTRIIGWINGRPVPQICGGSDDEEGGTAADGDVGKSKDDGFAPITSQEDLNRIVGARIAREREKFSDYSDLKAKAAEHDKALEEAKSEHDKALEQARREGEQSAVGRANGRLVNAEARALAAEAKFRNPTLAVRAIDLAEVKVTDDGTVDADAIRSALKTLADADPYLIDDGRAGKPKPDLSQGGGGSTDTPSVSRGRELFEARHKKSA